MAKNATNAKPENPFDEPVAATASNPFEGVAQETVVPTTELPAGVVYVDLWNMYQRRMPDGSLREYATLDAVTSAIADEANAATIDSYLAEYEDYVRANLGKFFTKPERAEGETKKDKKDKDGNIIPKGTPIPAKPGGLMEGAALQSAITRHLGAVQAYIAWQLRRSA